MTHIAFDVLPITERQKIPLDAIEDVVQQIVDRFHPKRIILFGSYAYGEPRPDSDVDLMVVMDTSLGEMRQAVEILKGISYRFGIDLLVYTPQRLSQRLMWGDPFLQDIVMQGKVMYESAGG